MFLRYKSCFTPPILFTVSFDHYYQIPLGDYRQKPLVIVHERVQRQKWGTQELEKKKKSRTSIRNYIVLKVLASVIPQRWKTKCCWVLLIWIGGSCSPDAVLSRKKNSWSSERAPVKRRHSWTGLKLTLLWSYIRLRQLILDYLMKATAVMTDYLLSVWSECTFPFVLQVLFLLLLLFFNIYKSCTWP